MELQERLTVRENEFTKALQKIEQNDDAKGAFQRQTKDLQNRFEDLQGDMESEREARRRLESDKRMLIDEVEKLHADILNRPDVEQVQRDVTRARDEEVRKLNRQLEQVYRDHENQISELRQRHATQFDEHLTELESTKRQLHTLAKDYQALLENFNVRNNEVKSFTVYKQEAEKKRRQLETVLQELQQKFNDSERTKNEILEKLQRLQQEHEAVQGAHSDVERNVQNYERAIGTLKRENQELKEYVQDENRQKMSLSTKLRQIEEFSMDAKDHLDEREEELSRMNEKLLALVEQNKKVVREAEQVFTEQNDELRRKFQNEKEDLLQQISQEKASHSKLTQINQKYLNDINDLSIELERYRAAAQGVNKDKRIFERKIQEEKVTQETLRTERDQLERELREKDTQRLNTINELNELRYHFEKVAKQLKDLQIEETAINSNDVAARMKELDAIKRGLGQEEICSLLNIPRVRSFFSLEFTVQEQNTQIIELEDELQTSEDARLRLEVNINALKQRLDLIQRDIDRAEVERRDAISNRNRAHDVELEETERAKQQLIQQRDKLEAELQTLRPQLEEARQEKEQALRASRRFQVIPSTPLSSTTTRSSSF